MLIHKTFLLRDDICLHYIIFCNYGNMYFTKITFMYKLLINPQ